MINRSALIVKPKQAMVDWINQQSNPEHCCITLEDAREDCTVILIPEFEDARQVKTNIRELHKWIFESELHAWFTDKTAWPQNRSFKVFQEWFEIEIHSLVVDASEDPIENYLLDDSADEPIK